jgi:transcriptional regulator GlxA family with amidase domain
MARRNDRFNRRIVSATAERKVNNFSRLPMKPVHLPPRAAVRAAIAALLQQGDTSLQCAAHRLNVSPRSLQRHLVEMGTTYSEMVAEIRLATACRLLIESDERIADIASRLSPSSWGC